MLQCCVSPTTLLSTVLCIPHYTTVLWVYSNIHMCIHGAHAHIRTHTTNYFRALCTMSCICITTKRFMLLAPPVIMRNSNTYRQATLCSYSARLEAERHWSQVVSCWSSGACMVQGKAGEHSSTTHTTLHTHYVHGVATGMRVQRAKGPKTKTFTRVQKERSVEQPSSVPCCTMQTPEVDLFKSQSYTSVTTVTVLS